jgi:hypothetical protein
MQDADRAAEVPSAHHDGPLEDPLEQAPPRSRVHASLGQAPSCSRGCAPPSSWLRLARGCTPPSGRLRPVRGGALPPRAGSASLEGPLRPRAGSASLEGAPHACACPRTRAFNTLTPVGQRHHAHGARAPAPPHQLPRREPIPITVGGGLCGVAGASPVTPCTCSGTANAPNPRRGAGCTLDLLSCDLTGLGGSTRPVGRHPCHYYGMAAAPVRTGARQALWQRLQHYGTCGNGMPPYLPLYSVRADVSDSLEPI